MKKSLSIRLIFIFTIIILFWSAAQALVVISSASKAQTRQVDVFVSMLKTEQANEERLLKESLKVKGESVVELLAPTAAGMIANYDDAALKKLVQSTTKDKDFAFVTFYDAEGKPLTQAPPEIDDHRIETLSAEIHFNDEKVGKVSLGLDFSSIKANMAELTARIQEKIAEANKANREEQTYLAKLIAASCCAGVVLLWGVIYTVLSRVVIRPIKQATGMIKDIAEGEGDLTKRMGVTRSDEIGQMSGWFNLFIEKLQLMVKDIAANTEKLNSASVDLSGISGQLSKGTESVSTKTNAVACATEEMNTNITTIAATMEQASSNIGVVAASAEEMTTSINEIAQNTAKASQITTGAVELAKNSSQRVEGLGNAAQEISKVTATITEISEQTNLLALNATIEAARAGEAGKGFAVVANEIKELARQTAEATEDIRKRIEGIQESIAGTIADIEKVPTVINEVNEIVSVIAASVEEQSATTQEIANNVAQASGGIQEVSENVNQSSEVSNGISKEISEVNCAVGEIANSSSQVNMSAEGLLTVVENLRSMMARFKV